MSLQKKLSFQLIKKPLSSLSASCSSDENIPLSPTSPLDHFTADASYRLTPNNNPAVLVDKEQIVDLKKLSSSQLLDIIMNDIQGYERAQPLKKVKPELSVNNENSPPCVGLSSESPLPSAAPLLQNTAPVVGCNCKKTKCLKLYCECFSSGGYCKPGCSCLDCCNNNVNQELRAEVIEEILQREPKAFNTKSFKENSDKQQHFRGCNCKKSGCQKKYCECFNYGFECGKHCKCEGCKNCPPSKGDDLPDPQPMKKYASSCY